MVTTSASFTRCSRVGQSKRLIYVKIMSGPWGSAEPSPHSLGEAVARLKSRWGWFLAFGLLCMFFGVLALTLVATSTLAMVFFLAVMLILAGGAEIVLGFNSRDWPSFF